MPSNPLQTNRPYFAIELVKINTFDLDPLNPEIPSNPLQTDQSIFFSSNQQFPIITTQNHVIHEDKLVLKTFE
jgi:hypothetical protein